MADFRQLFIKTIVFCMAMMLVGFFLSSCKDSDAIETPPPKPVNVAVRKVTMVSDNISILVSSFLEAEKIAPISFQIPGKIVRVNFDLGNRVKKNQVVAEVEIDDYQSHLEIAQAQLMKAQDVFNRLTPLFKEGVIPEKTLVEITSGLAQARAGKNIAKKQVRDTKLRAPFSGVIGMKAIEIGQMISPGIPVFTVVKNDKIYACASIPESEIGQIKIDQKARVTVPALDDGIFFGIVKYLSAVATPQTRTYTAKIFLDNPGFILRSGMIANVAIETENKIDLLTIPSRAIVRDFDNLTYVFLADKQNLKAFRRRVFPGSVHKNEIRIKRGLLPEDIFIIAGQHKLTDGCDITIIEN